ncbi:hypothetical protein FRC09_008069 [Ceratobasidium sp. 395]|nr:hypothetical protein FRC09_008069 [Ceratobasidium sp. 395]
MLSAKILTALALFAVSTSGLSVGHSSRHVAHRRHASRAVRNSVVGARGSGGVIVGRNALPALTRRGIKARRCAPKNSSIAPSSTPVPETEDPEPTSSSAAPPPPDPTPTSTQPPKSTDKPATRTSKSATKTSTSAEEDPTPTSGSGGGSNGGTHTGQATFYGTGLGACGITNKDTDYIAAVSHLLFDSFPGYGGGNPNANPICNKKVTAHYQGKSVTVVITDRCVGCAFGDLDFSPAAFDNLADQALGRLDGMTWSFN